MADGSDPGAGVPRAAHRGAKVALAFLIGAFCLCALELALAGLHRGGLIGVRPPPAYRQEARFFRGGHPEFGVWHVPNAEFEHRSACFHARYRSNSLGLRDRERERRSDEQRVIVLGDSFAEGWGLEEGQRMSNLLEQATGLAHLNFGVAHFGPYQALLAYRSVAREFDHDAVILALLPENDFVDIDLELALQMPNYSYNYRPYLVRTADGYEHFDHRENSLRRLLRRHSWTWAATGRAALGLRDRLLGKPSGPPAVPRFYDFSDEQFDRLEHILAALADETADKELVIALLPVRRDFRRFASAGPDRLSRRLERLASRDHVRVVDLLPLMAAETRDWRSYFFECDYHWSAHANAVAARLLERELAGEIYPALP